MAACKGFHVATTSIYSTYILTYANEIWRLMELWKVL